MENSPEVEVKCSRHLGLTENILAVFFGKCRSPLKIEPKSSQPIFHDFDFTLRIRQFAELNIFIKILQKYIFISSKNARFFHLNHLIFGCNQMVLSLKIVC